MVRASKTLSELTALNISAGKLSDDLSEVEAESGSSTDGDDEEEDVAWRATLPSKQDIPPEYWHMQKLVKYMKVS